MTELSRPRVLLLGDPSARPDGLERALVRGGFQITEAERLPAGLPAGHLPDLILVASPQADEFLKRELDALGSEYWRTIPSIVVLGTEDIDGPTRAMTMGADDALAAPIRLNELRARIDARLRARGDVKSLHQSVRYSRMMFDIFQDVCTSLRPGEILQTLVRRVGQSLSISRCSFILTPAGDRFGRVTTVWENPSITDLRIDLGLYPELLEAIRTARPVFIPDLQTHPLLETMRQRWTEQQIKVEVRSLAALPIGLQGRTTGILLLRTREGEPPLTEKDVEFANTLAGSAAKVLESEQRREAIYRRQGSASATDPLTGCGSLDALDRRIREEFERARRYALSFSLILLDVDRFRIYNERLGNAGGDRLLAELGVILQRELRAPDFVSRYGGDEFALILPETDLEGARRSIGRVRQRISIHPFPELQPQDRPQLSAGIVTFPHPSAVQTEDLFALVEAALLRGKSQTEGRIGTAESVASAVNGER